MSTDPLQPTRSTDDEPPLAMRLGVDAYSLRSQGWDAFGFLDFAGHQGASVVHFSEPKFLGSTETAYLDRVKAHADGLGIDIEVGMTSICPTSSWFKPEAGAPEAQIREMLPVAKRLGSPILRCYMGSSEDREGPSDGAPLEPQSSVPLTVHIENTINVCRAVRDDVLDLGLKLGIENHAGDLQSHQLRALIEEAGPEYVGAVFDAGNAAWALEDPHAALENLAPYVVSTHIRDSAVWEVPEGLAVQWVPMGTGNVDVDGLARLYARACPGKPFTMEVINTPNPRVYAFWSESFWRAYPDTQASSFTRFLAIARRGSPYAATFDGPSEATDEDPDQDKKDRVASDPAAIEQERLDVEHAIRYSKEVLHIGT
jgi:sugar phosphate isomerase/epimerase